MTKIEGSCVLHSAASVLCRKGVSRQALGVTRRAPGPAQEPVRTEGLALLTVDLLIELAAAPQDWQALHISNYCNVQERS